MFILTQKLQAVTFISRISKRWLLTAFVDVCRNLDGTGGVVDLVFEIWIINKLQLQRGRGLRRGYLFIVLRLLKNTRVARNKHKTESTSK